MSHCRHNEVTRLWTTPTPSCDSLFLLSIQWSNIHMSGISDLTHFLSAKRIFFKREIARVHRRSKCKWFLSISWCLLKILLSWFIAKENILKKQWECFQIFCKYSDGTLYSVYNYFSTDRTCDTLKFWCIIWKKMCIYSTHQKAKQFLGCGIDTILFRKGVTILFQICLAALEFSLKPVF